MDKLVNELCAVFKLYGTIESAAWHVYTHWDTHIVNQVAENKIALANRNVYAGQIAASISARIALYATRYQTVSWDDQLGGYKVRVGA